MSYNIMFYYKDSFVSDSQISVLYFIYQEKPSFSLMIIVIGDNNKKTNLTF